MQIQRVKFSASGSSTTYDTAEIVKDPATYDLPAVVSALDGLISKGGSDGLQADAAKQAIVLARSKPTRLTDSTLVDAYTDLLGSSSSVVTTLSEQDSANTLEHLMHAMFGAIQVPAPELETKSLPSGYTGFSVPDKNVMELSEDALPHSSNTGNLEEVGYTLFHESQHQQQQYLACIYYISKNPLKKDDEVAAALKLDTSIVAKARTAAASASASDLKEGETWYEAFYGSGKAQRDLVHQALNLKTARTKAGKAARDELAKLGYTGSLSEMADAAYLDLPEEADAFKAEGLVRNNFTAWKAAKAARRKVKAAAAARKKLKTKGKRRPKRP